MKKPKEDEWVPTQEELLEEAKITEQENLASLGGYFLLLFQFFCSILIVEKYQKMESEKKNKRTVKRVHRGPVIQYYSTRMPLIEEIDVVENKTFVIFSC